VQDEPKQPVDCAHASELALPLASIILENHPAILSEVKVHWIRSNGFVLGLLCAVALAFLFPQPGSRAGFLNADILNAGGVALILFLQGLSLAFEKVKSGAGNWRLHLMIQGFTFVVFPLIGVLVDLISPRLWPGQPEAVRAGFLYLCVLPSTVSTSVVLTAVAGGNTASALFNAALSNISGVFLTPVLVHLLMQSTGRTGELGPLLGKILLLTLVPFFVGMWLRRFFAARIEQRKAWVARLSNTVILFIVYSAFCDSIVEKVWQRHGLSTTIGAFAEAVLLFAFVSGLAWSVGRALGFSREDAIAAYFCAVKKTLAMGVPMAMLIFGQRADLSLILLPIMFYHPLQLLANGILANHWARQHKEAG